MSEGAERVRTKGFLTPCAQIIYQVVCRTATARCLFGTLLTGLVYTNFPCRARYAAWT